MDTNLLMLSGKKKRKKSSIQQPVEKKMSKKMQKKLQNIEKEKARKEKRFRALETLEMHKLAEGALSLMYSSGTLGKAETMREKLRRALQCERAGLPIPKDIPLLHDRSTLEHDGNEVSSDNSDRSLQSSYSKDRILKPLKKKRKQDHDLENNVDVCADPDLEITLKQELASHNEGHAKRHLISKEVEEVEASIRPCQAHVYDDGVIMKPFTNNDVVKEVSNKSNFQETEVNDYRPSSVHIKKFVEHVSRPDDVDKKRKDLPILMMEQEIMEAIHEHNVIIVCGETGSGKTTQVPQFLYEAGYGSSSCKDRSGIIGVTQPRKVAVLATAKRVAYELNLQLGKEVGFQVRHGKNIGDNGRIKFMTDGILVRELKTDFLLRKYSVIVLDEAHERSLNTDILIGMLARILPLRQKLHDQSCRFDGHRGHDLNECSSSVAPLKLVIMSATLRVDDFTSNSRMFPVPPLVIRIPSRQFPVTDHFSAKTELLDYQNVAFKKVCAIHKKLLPGGILVFLTGQREVESLCRKLRQAFPKPKTNATYSESQDRTVVIDKASARDEQVFGELDLSTITDAVDGEENADSDFFEAIDDPWSDNEVSEFASCYETSGDDSITGDDESSLTSGQAIVNAAMPACQKTKKRKPEQLYVLPLYAMLPASSQLQVFGQVPDGTRLVVVATNVAETSLTIPGIRYVVDCGRAKERVYHCSGGASRFEIHWINKASAAQRSGRAGRTGPGHCYRLYSSAVFNDTFPEFAAPEISTTPIEGVVLLLKCMGISKVVNFPFPTPPEPDSLLEGEKCLKALSALNPSTGLPTPIGRVMDMYPINPRHARMLISVIQAVPFTNVHLRPQLLVAYSIALAAALSLENPFLKDTSAETISEIEQAQDKAQPNKSHFKSLHKKFFNSCSDAFSRVNVLHAYEKYGNSESFCRLNGLNHKVMNEMSKLRRQLVKIVIRTCGKVCEGLGLEQQLMSGVLAGLEEVWQESLLELKPEQEKILQQAICAGWADRVARKQAFKRESGDGSRRSKAVRYESCAVAETVYLHPSSSVHRTAPDYLVYNELITTSKPYLFAVTSIDPEYLVMNASHLCTFSKPLEDPPPWYDSDMDQVMCWVSPSFGPNVWELPLHSYPLKTGKARTSVFACALLKGQVLHAVRKLQPCLSADPSILLKPEARVHKRVNDLLWGLGEGNVAVDSRTKLAKMWQVNRLFLYSEILSWVQARFHKQFPKFWETMLAECLN